MARTGPRQSPAALLDELAQAAQEADDDEHGLAIVDRRARAVLERLFSSDSSFVQEVLNARAESTYEYEDDEGDDVVELDVTAWAARLAGILHGAADHIRLAPEPEAPVPKPGTRVFIVHGHDHVLRDTIAGYVKDLGLKPVILQSEASKGRTIIEKFESEGSTADFAIVLLTPDDVGGPRGALPERQRARPRQNVIFEMGYFIGQCTRQNVVGMYSGDDLELPSDYAGVIYIPVDPRGLWREQLLRELVEANMRVKVRA